MTVCISYQKIKKALATDTHESTSLWSVLFLEMKEPRKHGPFATTCHLFPARRPPSLFRTSLISFSLEATFWGGRGRRNSHRALTTSRAPVPTAPYPFYPFKLTKPADVGVIPPSVQMRKLRLWEAKYLVQGPTAKERFA